eukprot:1224567-Alexandrium_andersonii.AAC.1
MVAQCATARNTHEPQPRAQLTRHAQHAKACEACANERGHVAAAPLRAGAGHVHPRISPFHTRVLIRFARLGAYFAS